MRSFSKIGGGRRLRTVPRLLARVNYWAGKIDVKPTRIRIQAMKRKWASCSTKGWISLNHELANVPRGFQDYAIVHELLHLEIPNHGKLFKSMMNAYLPNWEKWKTFAFPFWRKRRRR